MKLQEQDIKAFTRHQKKYGVDNVTVEKFYKIKENKWLYSAIRMIEIYQGEEALRKYKEEVKKKKRSPYDPNWIMERENLSYEEAVEYVKRYKKNKSTSLESFIKRHGEEKGRELFAKFQKTSDSSSLEYHVRKYGETEGRELYNKSLQEASRRCIGYWTKRGFTEEEAKKKVSEFQLSTAGVHGNIYKEQGLSESEIDSKMKDIYKRRTARWCEHSYDYWMSHETDFNKVKIMIWIVKNQNIKNTCHEEVFSNLDKYEKIYNEYMDSLPEREKYYKLVDFWTSHNVEYVEGVENRSREYHIDHKYSKVAGWMNNVDPMIIGSHVNLEILSRSENCSKRGKCSITLDELYEAYNENQKD